MPTLATASNHSKLPKAYDLIFGIRPRSGAKDSGPYESALPLNTNIIVTTEECGGRRLDVKLLYCET